MRRRSVCGVRVNTPYTDLHYSNPLVKFDSFVAASVPESLTSLIWVHLNIYPVVMVIISWRMKTLFLVAHLDFVSRGRSETYLNSFMDATRVPC